jgi:hypothetical protein
MTLKGQLGKKVYIGGASEMVVATRTLRLVTVVAGVGVPRCGGGDGAVNGGVVGILGGSAGACSGEAGSSVNSSGVSGDGWSDGGTG